MRWVVYSIGAAFCFGAMNVNLKWCLDVHNSVPQVLLRLFAFGTILLLFVPGATQAFVGGWPPVSWVAAAAVLSISGNLLMVGAYPLAPSTGFVVALTNLQAIFLCFWYHFKGERPINRQQAFAIVGMIACSAWLAMASDSEKDGDSLKRVENQRPVTAVDSATP
jgi:hypothetical protein